MDGYEKWMVTNKRKVINLRNYPMDLNKKKARFYEKIYRLVN